jgi:hypothetical protein
MAQTETGAAGTMHFEPGGVTFWSKTNKPAGGLFRRVKSLSSESPLSGLTRRWSRSVNGRLSPGYPVCCLTGK